MTLFNKEEVYGTYTILLGYFTEILKEIDKTLSKELVLSKLGKKDV